MKLSKYQQWILEEMKKGAVIMCTEGENYKAWLKYKDGTKKIIRRDSAEKLLSDMDKFIFGDYIRLREV